MGKIPMKPMADHRDARRLPAAGPASRPPAMGPLGQHFPRRSFLKLTGYSLAAGLITSCSRGSQRELVAAMKANPNGVPGIPSYYASTCGGCSAGCGILVKTREGRPIKIEGYRDPASPEGRSHPISGGGLCAAGQAAILGLYDDRRVAAPLDHGRPAAWPAVDRKIKEALKHAGAKGKVVLLGRSVTGPSLKSRIQNFLKKFPSAQHVQYDPLSVSAVLDAHRLTHGVRLLPHFLFQEADLIVSFGADFLETWISPVEFAAAYAARRVPDAGEQPMSRHVQIESRLSLTGSNADLRIAMDPASAFSCLLSAARRLAHLAQRSFREAAVPAAAMPDFAKRKGEMLADWLWKARKRSLVISGRNNLAEQIAVNFINDVLGNYGHTLDILRPSLQFQGSDADVAALLRDMQQERVGALIVADANPVYELPFGDAFKAAMQKVPLVISAASHLDETSSQAGFLCPIPHALEAWDDSEPVAGVVSLSQPVIAPLRSTRHLRESLAVWSGAATSDRTFQRQVLGKLSGRSGASLDGKGGAWESLVNQGFFTYKPSVPPARPFDSAALARIKFDEAAAKPGFTVALHATLSMWDGRHAHNAWLHELPDPMTRLTWGNAALLAEKDAKSLGVADGDGLRVSWQSTGGRGRDLVLPVLIQPGQAAGVVGLALGYGRLGTDRFTSVGPDWLQGEPTVKEGEAVGCNAAALLRGHDGQLDTVRHGVSLASTGTHPGLARTQEEGWQTESGRPAPLGERSREAAKSMPLSAFTAGSQVVHEEENQVDLWPDDHKNNLPHWGMVIDLSRCTGCSACVVACQVENNIPVVGRDEIQRHREMHWLRIDRYFSEEVDHTSAVHQPMLCQQCDHAPCETVCPTYATVHSEEGLNEQVYNRCIGTRYCMNNCPYKVRRFNWFAYSRDSQLENLGLNPDVTVRSRGVMEKCTFCVQRIQAGKAKAKRNGRAVRDGDIQPACAQACPTQAIVFGNAADEAAQVSKLAKSQRHYHVLHELNTKPSVGYLARVRNDEI